MSTNHRRLALRLGLVWLVVVALGTILFLVITFPPQAAGNVSKSIQDTTKLLTLAAWPIFTLVITAVIGTVLMNRAEPSEVQMSARSQRGNSRLAGTWIGIVSLIVLTLAILGTLTLSNEEAAEVLGLGGRGTSNGATGGNGEVNSLDVQVIAQQWQFTYRYPSYGGMESAHLVLPANANVTFHITSLDVTHSFWFPALGVKADAVPLHDNTFGAQPQLIGTYRIVCSELCGLWHGAMSDNSAQIMSGTDFATWAEQQEAADGPVMKYLPPFSYTYVPDPGAYGT